MTELNQSVLIVLVVRVLKVLFTFSIGALWSKDNKDRLI